MVDNGGEKVDLYVLFCVEHHGHYPEQLFAHLHLIGKPKESGSVKKQEEQTPAEGMSRLRRIGILSCCKDHCDVSNCIIYML